MRRQGIRAMRERPAVQPAQVAGLRRVALLAQAALWIPAVRVQRVERQAWPAPSQREALRLKLARLAVWPLPRAAASSPGVSASSAAPGGSEAHRSGSSAGRGGSIEQRGLGRIVQGPRQTAAPLRWPGTAGPAGTIASGGDEQRGRFNGDRRNQRAGQSPAAQHQSVLEIQAG
jgi:hypothetical protein